MDQILEQLMEWYRLAREFCEAEPHLAGHIAAGVIGLMLLFGYWRMWRGRNHWKARVRQQDEHNCHLAYAEGFRGPPSDRHPDERIMIIARHAIDSMKEVAMKPTDLKKIRRIILAARDSDKDKWLAYYQANGGKRPWGEKA